MSKVRKAKKLRQPNVPEFTGPMAAVEPQSGSTGDTTQLFDYTYIKRDLTRIGVLAASFIVVLVALSFFIR